MLREDRALLARLRAASLAAVPEITWTAAGVKLLEVYRETIAAHRAGAPCESGQAREAVCVKS